MGFHDGWGTTAGQLEELAKGLRGDGVNSHNARMRRASREARRITRRRIRLRQ